ncbi:MAG: ABC transporter permease [Bacteroidetes bacterium]|nr:ABC transporter permease [Bacteroidota bacterium]
MLKQVLRTSIRNLTARSGFALLNVGGLVLGLTCFILIGLYVQDELSYDRHHEKADEIHRMGLHIFLDGTESNFATVAAPVAAGLVENFPEVSASTRLSRGGFPVLRYDDKAFSEERFYWADSTVFDVFTMPFLAGDPKTALVAPYSVVFTESMARKYFGGDNPMGKMVNMDGRQDYTITGVIEDAPRNSHFHYDFLAAMSARGQSRNTSWATQNNFNTYFVLDPGTPADVFQEKLKSLVVTYVNPEISELFNVSVEEMYASGAEFEYLVHPLTDIHLKSNLRAEFEPNGNILYVFLFSGIAIAILLIACVNYVNLSTAISSQKAKEVGIRKAVGSTRGQLIAQFLSDSVVLSLISMGISLLVVQLALSPFNTFTGKDLQLPIFGSPFVIPAAMGLALIIGLIAGSYPAFVLSSFLPAAVLKGSGPSGKSRSALRNGLIVFQYSISAVLVLASLVVYGQLNFIQNTDLGFSGDQVIVVEKVDDLGDRLDAFKQIVLNQASVLSVANSQSLFGEIQNDNLFRVSDQPESENKLIFLNRTDEGFAETYQLEITDGRYFSRDRPGDEHGIVLNEKAVSLLGLSDPVGKNLTSLFSDQELTVIGVVKDFHVESLQNEIRPFGFMYYGENGLGRNLSVRAASDDFSGVIQLIEKEWNEISNGQAFEYEFFNTVFEERYLSEKSIGQTLTVFAGIAVLIACLGLFGLAAFVTTQRTKEIGIRKSLGASATGIVLMLFRDFGKWILLANIISWPIAYIVMNNWLQNFVFRTDIRLLDFPLALVAGLVVAFLTIGYQTIGAARSNPVQALRHD